MTVAEIVVMVVCNGMEGVGYIGCDSCRNSSYGCMQWYGRLQATYVVIVAEIVVMVVCKVVGLHTTYMYCDSYSINGHNVGLPM